MAINTGSNTHKALRVGSTVISRAFLGTQKVYDQLDYPTLDLNFALTKSLDSRITFTRASSGTYFDSNGVLQTATTNSPRFDHNPTSLESLGLLIEGQRTNSIRNNTMQGAVVGTPGTLPANWAVFATNGLTTGVVGIGLENGINYIDIRVSGTPSGSAYTLFFEGSIIPALNNQDWVGSFWCKQVGGSQSNLTIGNLITFRSSAGSPLQSSNPAISVNTNFNRFNQAILASNASIAFVHSGIWISTTAGLDIDITLRIGMPQLELGAFVTSVIPTFGTAATRALDLAVMTGTNFSSWYKQDEGTLFAEYSYSVTGVSNLCAYSLDNGTANEAIVNATAIPNIDRVLSSAGGVSQANFGNFNYIVGQVVKRAVAVKLNNAATTANGSAVATDNNYTMPVPTQLTIGAAGYFISSRINGCIRRIAYFNRRLADSEIQLLTV